jgi:hypothetical protein
MAQMMVWTPARFSYGLTILAGPTMTGPIISQGKAQKGPMMGLFRPIRYNRSVCEPESD